MKKIRRLLIPLVIPLLLTGCDSGNPVETTLPTSPPATPPEGDQMKNDMIKHLKLKPYKAETPERDHPPAPLFRWCGGLENRNRT